MATEKRINFAIIKSKYNAIGKGNVRLTQSSLFLTKPIDPTKSTYDFDVLENQTQTLQPDEIRLNINDEFTITSLGLYLYGRWTAVDADGAKVGSGLQLMTYAPLELNAANLNLKGYYAGQLKIAVNNIVYMEKWDNRKHEYIPRTEFAGQLAGTNAATIASNDFSKNAMFNLEPMIVLSGAKKNDISIRLPEAIVGTTSSFKDAAGNTITIVIDRVALRLYGLNAQNGAKFQN